MTERGCISVQGDVKDVPFNHPAIKLCGTCVKTITVSNNSITEEHWK